MKKFKQYLLSRFVVFLNYNNLSNKKWLTYDVESCDDRGIVVESPDSRDPCGWHPLKMHQSTRALPVRSIL